MKVSRKILCVDDANGNSAEVSIDGQTPEAMRVLNISDVSYVTPYHSHTWRLTSRDLEDPDQTDLVLITEIHILYRDEQYKLTAHQPELHIDSDQESPDKSTYWIYKTGKAEPQE